MTIQERTEYTLAQALEIYEVAQERYRVLEKEHMATFATGMLGAMCEDLTTVHGVVKATAFWISRIEDLQHDLNNVKKDDERQKKSDNRCLTQAAQYLGLVPPSVPVGLTILVDSPQHERPQPMVFAQSEVTTTELRLPGSVMAVVEHIADKEKVSVNSILASVLSSVPAAVLADIAKNLRSTS